MPAYIRCPKCDSETVVRTATKGPNIGHRFYVCLRYPECKGKLAIGEQIAINRLSVEREEKAGPSALSTEFTKNTSGQGKLSEIPYEIRGWNWGAFFLVWIWGVFNRVWISLLCFVPFVGWIMPFILGIEGNQLAWRNKEWDSIEHFKRTQRTWAWWGLGIFIFSIILFFMIVIVFA